MRIYKINNELQAYNCDPKNISSLFIQGTPTRLQKKARFYKCANVMAPLKGQFARAS